MEAPVVEHPKRAYGLQNNACGTCAKAKVKCMPSDPVGNKCYRCQRLRKECEPPNKPKKRLKATSVAGLEKKLDDIVTILSTSNHIPKASIVQRQDDIPTNTKSIDPPYLQSQNDIPMGIKSMDPPHLLDHVTEQIPNDETSMCFGDNLKTPSTSNRVDTDLYPSSTTIPPVIDLDDDYAHALLAIFKSDMAPYCPFVLILPNISPRQFQAERPFLWKAIITAASHRNPTFQDAFGIRSFENFITELLLRGQTASLDKLQALLVHLGWFHYQSIINNQTFNLIYLVKSMVTTLGLQRSLKQGATMEKVSVDGTRQANKDRLSSRRLEELRAYAGCFYATSMMPPGSSVESMRYTVQLEEACKTVAEAGEFQSDIILFHLVKLQQLTRKIKHTFFNLEVGFGPRIVPQKMCMDLLQRELETFKHELPENLKSHFLISINYSIAEINLYEAGLNDADFTTSDSLERLSILNSCLISVKTFLDDKVTQWIDFSIAAAYTTWVQVGYGILVALKLCTCKADGWDREHARSALNIQHTIDFLIAKLKIIISIRGRSPELQSQPQSPNLSTTTTPEKDIFIRFSRQLLRIKSLYEASLHPHPSNSSPEPEEEIPQPFNQHDESTTAPLVIPESHLQDEFLIGLDDNFWLAFPSADDGFWNLPDVAL
ncbi:uncharacterized protein EAF02_006561 [Botrytis sinoallii]|uniref:uncharacterized protein n=1 Tax=Botrytis sinoallii TaxID=1463999 RepID=UPI00190105C7|nr:uncharacterized protein EAF02_006561 [Botrytis sinoallii]KAF7881873.1 hypothetical protein EAF02_006561 [Botrytis sinoallii]